VGPVILLIHVASINVPFTSESKDAIADSPVIKEEVDLAIKEVARKLKHYLSKQDNLKKRREKEIIITKVLPKMALKVANILEKDVPDISPVVAKIMGNLLVHRKVKRNEDGTADIVIKVKNFGSSTHSFRVHEMLPWTISRAKPEPKVVTMGNDYDYIWDISAVVGSSKVLSYSIESTTDKELGKLPDLIVEGVEEELVTGAKAFKGI
jgi:DNA topoisomerase-6 subunit B